MQNEPNKPNYSLLGGITLFIGAAVAMIAANSSLQPLYRWVLDTHFTVQYGKFGLSKPLLLWVNDGLMAIFFLSIGLELKRELIAGKLSSPRQAALPLVGAIGGMVVPALIYYLFNAKDPAALRGWAIPTATDIAFALSVMAMLGDRIPTALKAFVLSLAVFDDLGAIVVIAVFYTHEISIAAQFAAVSVLAVLFILNLRRVTRLGPYLLLGTVLWACVLKSGVHATLAGVLVAMAVPYRLTEKIAKKEPAANESFDRDSPLAMLEHALQPWLVFLILPLFAFANSGLVLRGINTTVLLQPVTIGIAVGLCVGKFVGVALGSGIMIGTGLAKLPERTSMMTFIGATFLTGIGYTMSLFIGGLAFAGNWAESGRAVRIGVIAGSLVSGLIGVGLILYASRRRKPAAADAVATSDPSATSPN